MGILYFVAQIYDFVKLQGDLQKQCKITGVLEHKIPDAYVFISKIMGGTLPHVTAVVVCIDLDTSAGRSFLTMIVASSNLSCVTLM